MVQVGKNGVAESLVAAVTQALLEHELVKVKFVAFKSEKRSLAEQIAERSSSQLVDVIGNIAIIYKEHPELEKREIELPST